MSVSLEGVPAAADVAPAFDRTATLRHQLRTVVVLATSDFKSKYAGSALGYVWTLAKPLALFSVLYVIFGLLIKITSLPHYPLLLLIGMVFYLSFQEATSTIMSSVVNQGPLVRRLAFPRLIIPLSTSVTALFTFAFNASVIALLIGWNRVVPRVEWLALVPLVVELYLFGLAAGLILAALFVRFRDIGQVWELVVQILFYVSPIIYPIQLLPAWAQKLVLLNPLAQTIQDARAVILHSDAVPSMAGVYGSMLPRLVPMFLVLLLLVVALRVFQSQAPSFAEHV
ncbi:MAG TPA: ABC transporter permease [Gaiellaceae bacterium]|nr:ABC transporter permease [Gaiellaceae bacterium]